MNHRVALVDNVPANGFHPALDSASRFILLLFVGQSFVVGMKTSEFLEEQMTEKRNWTKPELIALLRGDQSENLLSNCKTAGTPGSQAAFFNNCDYNLASVCTPCAYLLGS